MKRRKRIAVLAAAALVAAGGCAGPPRPGVPIERDRLEDIVGLAMSGASSGPLRATGVGRLTEAGDSLGFAFAVLYDPPGWLRAEARPPLAVAPGPPGVSALLEGDRVTARLAASDSWVTVRLRDVLPGIERIDPGAFIVGRPDLRFLTLLRRARLERAAHEIIVTGDLFGRRIEAAIDTTSFLVTRIGIRNADASSMTVSYGGRGWNRDARMPRTVTVSYADEKHPTTLALTYDHAASEDFVDRLEHTVTPPAGAPVLQWKDLGTWRKP